MKRPKRVMPRPLIRPKDDPPPQHAANYGWTCPKCGNSYAPFVAKCWVCRENPPTITTTGTVFYPYGSGQR